MTPAGSADVLLDTDVLSFFFNRDPIRVPRYKTHLENRVLHASFVSVAEMRFGAEIRGWGPARVSRLERSFQWYRVIESTPEIGIAWARIRADARHAGRTIAAQDAWIAATAVTLRVPLVTPNARHYAEIPVLRVITEPDP